jgi:hypothetical protein
VNAGTGEGSRGRSPQHVAFCVKALASDLGRHVNYVYAMTARGFAGKSVAEAKEWIETHGFVIVRGVPKLKPRMDTDKHR